MGSKHDQPATLDEIIGWLKGLDRERVLGGMAYGASCPVGAYHNQQQRGVWVASRGLLTDPDLQTIRELGPDEKFVMRTFDRVVRDRGTDHLTVGEFLDELREVAWLTDNTRLLQALWDGEIMSSDAVTR